MHDIVATFDRFTVCFQFLLGCGLRVSFILFCLLDNFLFFVILDLLSLLRLNLRLGLGVRLIFRIGVGTAFYVSFRVCMPSVAVVSYNPDEMSPASKWYTASRRVALIECIRSEPRSIWL